jgi:hypothetical protein
MQAGNNLDSPTTINTTKDSATYKHGNVYWINLAKGRVQLHASAKNRQYLF